MQESQKVATRRTRSTEPFLDDVPYAQPNLTPAERTAKGKAARKVAKRSSHAEWSPPANRRDPVSILEEQAASRIPELVPIRYGRMLISPFTFYRGGAAIMAADLASTPQSGIAAQLCGDAHLSNFGFFASPERDLLFDINDFDETITGPWEWDVKRLAASFVIAGRENGYSAKECRKIVDGMVSDYQSWMRSYAEMGNLDVWYTHVDADEIVTETYHHLTTTQLKRVEITVAKARAHDALQAFNRLGQIVEKQPRIISDPPLIVPVEELMESDDQNLITSTTINHLKTYAETLVSDRRHLLEEYQLRHLARKVVGVGSVGTRAWIVLLTGRDENDPLFLQVKEAGHSVLEPYVGSSGFENQGERVVAGQRLMQAASDIFLGWERMKDVDGFEADFYVRQLRDWKGSFRVERMSAEGMEMYGQLCGWTLARAHARSGDRIAISAYIGPGAPFRKAIVAFAEAYADQNERDYQTFKQAVDSGSIEAVTGL